MSVMSPFMLLMNLAWTPRSPLDLLKQVPDSMKLKTIEMLGKGFIESAFSDYKGHPENIKEKIKIISHNSFDTLLGETKSVLGNRTILAASKVLPLTEYKEVQPEVLEKVEKSFNTFFPKEHNNVVVEFMNKFKTVAHIMLTKLSKYDLSKLQAHMMKKFMEFAIK